jgi:AraC-like DNA-binding protein
MADAIKKLALYADGMQRCLRLCTYADPARAWTVEELARKAALSRSVFFDRFTGSVGVPPIEYLLGWRMAIAKNLLRQQDFSLTEVAERVGYGSASTFSTAFSRHVGQSPSRFAREASTQV